MTHPEQLIADYLDDALDDAGQVELRTWLKADTANMRRFTEAILFEQEIRALVHAKAETESVTRFAESLAPMKKDAAGPPSVIPFESGIKSPRRLARAAVWLGAFTWFGNKANAAGSATTTLAKPAAILSQTTSTILMTKTTTIAIAAAILVGGGSSVYLIHQSNQETAALERETNVLSDRIHQARSGVSDDSSADRAAEKLPMDKDGKIDWKTVGRKAAQHQPRRGDPADRLDLELLQRDLLHLRKLLLEMSAEDLSAQLDEIAALDLDAHTRGQLNSSISGALAEKDPKMLLDKFSGELGDKDSSAQWVMRNALDRLGEDRSHCRRRMAGPADRCGKIRSKALDQGDFSLLLMESAVVKNLLMIDPAAATARVMALPEDRRPEFFRKWNYGHLEEQTDGAMAKLIRDTLPPDKVTGSLVHQAVQFRMQGGYGRMDRFIARANASDEEKAAIVAALMKIDSR